MDFDVLIKCGRVIDGTGQDSFTADIGVTDGRIVAIANLTGSSAATVIDASGLVVTPGFIDVHTHSEIALLTGVERYGGILQGVTTHFLGADGFGWAPLGASSKEYWEYTLFAYGQPQLDVGKPSVQEYLAQFIGSTPANVVAQVPHNAIRYAVMGWSPRPATSAELTAMCELTAQWMQAGAVSLSVGLEYQPGAYANTHELVALSKVVARYGGVFAGHLRYSELGKYGAWQEALAIGEQAQIPVHINHEFVNADTEQLLEEAVTRCQFSFDSYLYPAGCTHLTLLLPTWAQTGGMEGLRARLCQPVACARMADHMQRVLSQKLAAGGDVVFVATPSGRYVTESIGVAATRAGKSLGEFAVNVLREEDPYALMVLVHDGTAAQREQVMLDTARHPHLVLASDGIYHGQHGHPRAWGCFAQMLGQYVRAHKALTMAEAVRKMTAWPAQVFGLRDRGILAPGYAADIVVLNDQTVSAQATWESPRLGPVGIEYVMVNGEVVVNAGVPTSQLPGRVLQLCR